MAAQTDTLLELPTVEVNAKHMQIEQPGTLTETWSTKELSTLPAQSVSNFLGNNTGIYLKTYGNGSLATTSIRGASASQTTVIWNGIQIQSPMLGLLDWSLLPTAFADEISLAYGGNGAIWGSGAIGGALLMNNYADFSTKRQLQLAVSNGSFGLWNGQVTAKFSNKKWAFATRAFRQQAKNDFEYNLGNGLPSKRQTNSAMHQEGLLQEVYWRPNNKEQFGFNAWLQSAYRQIPPTTVQTKSLANQKDKAIRTAIHWHFATGNTRLQIRSCFFLESLLYRDELSAIKTPSHFWTSTSEVDWQQFLGSKLRFQLIGNQLFTKATIKNYQEKGKRQQTSAFASLRYTSKQWNTQLDIRQEWVNGRFLPVTPSLSAEAELARYLTIGGRIGRNYRLPTLNDLYWSPGGNRELQPESGWATEANLQFSMKKLHWGLEIKTSLFHRNIHNWIQWLPLNGNAYWSASNIDAVRSRGIENRLNQYWRLGHLKLSLDGGYSYILSTNTKAIALPKIEEGQQWFYVPKHQGFFSTTLNWKGIGLQYREQYTGKANSELGQLPGYRIATILLDYKGKCWNNHARFFLQLDNCWDETYRVIERRPMPGRSYQMGITVQLKN